MNGPALRVFFVACELAHASRELAYVKTTSGFELVFLTTDFAGRRRLIQVAAEISSPANCEQEIRASTEAGREFPDVERVLVSETEAPLGMAIPEAVDIVPVWWFLLS